MVPYTTMNRLKGQKREPLRSFVELAAELGITANALRGHLAQTKLERPRPQLKNKRKGSVSWYLPSEFRAWWAAHCELIGRPASPLDEHS
jgi:hypothetical protein